MKHRKNAERGAAECASVISPSEKPKKASPTYILHWLTIKQAASRLGVCERTIYHYLQRGVLAGERMNGRTIVNQETLARFVPKAPGRARTTTPPWRRASEHNEQVLTLISTRLYPGQEEQLASRLDAMRRHNSHCVSGTAARHLVRNKDDSQDITLVLVWRMEVMPNAEEREAALAALRAYLADVLDWDTARMKEGCALLHA